MPDSDPSDLRQLIRAQTMREVGVPVLLFTTASLDTQTRDGDEAAPVSRAANLRVSEVAAQLDLDLNALALFSADAYLLQSALGAAVNGERR